MKFSHYSAAPIKRVRSVPQTDTLDIKPQGLWLSVDGPDDWREWCLRTKYRVAEVQGLRYRVNLHLARMVILSTPQDLMLFTRLFAVVGPLPKLVTPIFIDWRRVAQKCAGIIIAPYIWSCRLELPWYYGWDCASGCVWDAAAVLSVRQLKSVRPRRRKAT